MDYKAKPPRAAVYGYPTIIERVLHMKLCGNSRCRFECPERGVFTNSLRVAVEWHNDGACVHCEVDGKDVGYLTFAGICRTVDEIPKNPTDYGVVFLCEESNTYYINLPDDILENLPEEGNAL